MPASASLGQCVHDLCHTGSELPKTIREFVRCHSAAMKNENCSMLNGLVSNGKTNPNPSVRSTVVRLRRKSASLDASDKRLERSLHCYSTPGEMSQGQRAS